MFHVGLPGAPPAYPGLANHHAPNSIHPPAYSPSHHAPPAYTKSYAKSFYQPNQHAFGSQFGKAGLGGNTYLGNNYYGGPLGFGTYRAAGSPFLANALFFGAGLRVGSRVVNQSRTWETEDDFQWRATTQAPYFENKIPGKKLNLKMFYEIQISFITFRLRQLSSSCRSHW